MASTDKGTFGGRLPSTVGLAVVSGIVSTIVGLVAKQVLAAWGVLDSLSKALGDFLHTHVTPELTGWLLALVIVVVLYGIALLMIRRSHKLRDTHHKDLQAGASVDARTQHMFTSKEKNDRRRALIKEVRDLAYKFNANRRGRNFYAYIVKQRAYLDIEPHLSDEYRAEIKKDSGRSLMVTSDDSSYGCTVFLKDVARLEREWNLEA